MKALVKSRAEPGLWLEEVPEPEIGINDVLIRVGTTGICGTDVHIHRWDAWAQRTIPVPLVVGHEFVGEVIEVGSNVSGFEPGDRVSGEGHVVCGRCRNCMAGRRHLCAQPAGLGVQRPGAFAELVALPMTNVWHHWPRVPDEVAAIFDPLGNAVHGTHVSRPRRGRARHRRRADRLHVGRGRAARRCAAHRRHRPRRGRLAIARRMGATLAVDPRGRDLADVQAELGMREGFDVMFEMSGSPEALRAGVGQMAHGGRVAILGIPTAPVELDLDPVIFNMLTLKGIYGREMYETWYQMSVMVDSGLDVTPVITHRFGFADFEEGFAVASSGGSGKVLLDWREA